MSGRQRKDKELAEDIQIAQNHRTVESTKSARASVGRWHLDIPIDGLESFDAFYESKSQRVLIEPRSC